MKRILLIGTITLVLLCCMGGVIAVVLYQANSPSSSSVPVYPGARNVRKQPINGSSFTLVSSNGQQVPVFVASNPNEDSFIFETPDSVRKVDDFYNNWLSARRWTPVTSSSRQSPFFVQSRVDFSQLRLDWEPGSIVPSVRIPQRTYTVFVDATNTVSNTLVTVRMLQSGP